MHEIELKFLVEESTANQLWPRATSLGITAGKLTTKTLASVYFDTQDHALKKAGVSLRLRRDGRGWVQTVKASAELHQGLSCARELETPASGRHPDLEAIPDQEIRDEIIKRVNGAPLQSVCETVVERRSGTLVLENGTRAELAIDVGEIRAQGRSEPFREVEIELIEGSPRGLFDLAHKLLPDGGLTFSRLSKAARGYMLATEGRIGVPPAPSYAETVSLEAADGAEVAARNILRECLRQITMNMEALRELDVPEGPHQLRVGLRRLRSAFTAFAPALKSPEMSKLSQEARWLGQEVGRLRNLDVLANDIVGAEARAHADEPALAKLAAALEKESAEIRGQVRTLMAEARAQAFVIDLARFVETRGWLSLEDVDQSGRLAAPVSEIARQALNKRWKKVRKQARGLQDLNTEQRHELRKELKKLRYVAEFFAPLFPAKKVDRFLKGLKKAQTIFGDVNDAANVRAHLSGFEALSHDLGGQRAIGWMIGVSQTRAEFAWAHAKGTWRKLVETGPFWK